MIAASLVVMLLAAEPTTCLTPTHKVSRRMGKVPSVRLDVAAPANPTTPVTDLTPVPATVTPPPTPASMEAEAPPPKQASAAPLGIPAVTVKDPVPLVTAQPSSPTLPAAERAVLSLLALCAVAFGLAYWQRQRKLASPDINEIEVLATRHFGPKHRLNVIQVDGKRLLVTLAPDGVRLLCPLDKDESNFAQVLGAQVPSPISLVPPAQERPSTAEVEGITRLKQMRLKRTESAS